MSKHGGKAQEAREATMSDTNGAAQDYLTAEAILAKDDIGVADVLVPEWGGKVQVRALTMGEVVSIRQAAKGDERTLMIQSLVAAMVQPRLTTEQAEAMTGKSSAAAQRVFTAIAQLNGMAEDQGVVAAQLAFRPGPMAPLGTGPGPGLGHDPATAAAGTADG